MADTRPLPPRTAATDRSVTSIPESQWTDRQRRYARTHGLAGRGSTPLPRRSAAVDRSIQATPTGSWTARQREYADMYGLFYGGDAADDRPDASAGPDDDAPGGSLPDWMPGGAPGAGPVRQAPADLRAVADKAAQDARNADAYAMIQETLDSYGLSGLAGFVWEQIVGGKSQAEVLRDIRKTEDFKRRFPAIVERERKGLSPLSPGEYVAYEKQARQVFRAAGLPEGFYDSNDDFTTFMVNDVSVSELTDRVTMASAAAYNTPVDVRRELARFGMRGGDLTAFFLDPGAAQPLLERKYGAARLSAAASRTGFGSLTEDEATDLFQSGTTEAQAQQGFSELEGQSELFDPLDRGEDAIGRQDQIGAAFKGNASAQRRIEQRKRRRQSQFEGGGSFAAGQGGVVGLGSAPQV